MKTSPKQSSCFQPKRIKQIKIEGNAHCPKRGLNMAHHKCELRTSVDENRARNEKRMLHSGTGNRCTNRVKRGRNQIKIQQWVVLRSTIK